MKKKITNIALIILIASTCSTLHSHEDKSFLGWLFSLVVDLGDEDQSNTKSTLEQEISNQIDHMLATSKQSYAVKKEIAQAKRTIAASVIQQLNANYYSSEHEKLAAAQTLTQAALLQFIADQTNKYAQEKAFAIYHDPNPPINPELLREHSPSYVAQKTNERILQDAQRAAQDVRYGTLRDFVGEPHRKKVQFIVEQEFGIHDMQAPHYYQSEPPRPLYPEIPTSSYSTHKPQQSKPTPKPSGDIHEIYPNLDDLARNKDFFGKMERMQIFRENDCCVCLDSFKDIGKRVTLFCGHSICATCLFGMLYISNATQCPMCRAEIKHNEFSADSLKKHVNVDELKQAHPNNLYTIRKYFPWA